MLNFCYYISHVNFQMETVKSMPMKLFKNINYGLLLSGVSLLGLSGCSTISDGVDAIGSGVVYVAEGTQKLTTDVTVEKESDGKFILQQSFNQPVKSLDSWAMRVEARELCPEGYIYLNRNALRSGGFGVSDADCTISGACDFQLQWRIKCQKVPQEPFSLFGKT